MRFGPVPVAEAVGAVAAHGVQAQSETGEIVVVKKGDTLTAEQTAALVRADVGSLVVARLDPGDIGENAAARRLAEAVAGPDLWIERAFTGRANLFASAAGVLLVDALAVERVNAVDERLTLATLPPFRAVEAGEMVGTVKVIPFALEGEVVERAVREAARSPLRVSPYRPRRVGVVSTLLARAEALGRREDPAGAGGSPGRRRARGLSPRSACLTRPAYWPRPCAASRRTTTC